MCIGDIFFLWQRAFIFYHQLHVGAGWMRSIFDPTQVLFGEEDPVLKIVLFYVFRRGSFLHCGLCFWQLPTCPILCYTSLW